MDLPTADKEQCAAFIVRIDFISFSLNRQPGARASHSSLASMILKEKVLMITHSNVLYYLKMSLRLYETS